MVDEIKSEKVFSPPAGFREIRSAIWLPETIGESISGVIQGTTIDPVRGKNWTILCSDNQIRVTPSHKVLQARMEAANLKDLDVVAIVYDGEEPPAKRGNNPTRIYRVFVK